jgi:sporulation protein YlmC with PRC-barrel domain
MNMNTLKQSVDRRNVEGGNMPEYLFDGKKLKKRSGQKEGELDGSQVKAWNGEKVGEIEGKNVMDSQGKKVLEFDGKNIKDDKGKKIATLEEVRKIVEGEAGVSLVAMWYFFVWK